MAGEQNEAQRGTLLADYTSPTLDYLQHELGKTEPDPQVACVDCPAGVWYWQEDEALSCFCTAMHRETWNGQLKAIHYCDGREQALARLAEARQRS